MTRKELRDELAALGKRLDQRFDQVDRSIASLASEQKRQPDVLSGHTDSLALLIDHLGAGRRRATG